MQAATIVLTAWQSGKAHARRPCVVLEQKGDMRLIAPCSTQRQKLNTSIVLIGSECGLHRNTRVVLTHQRWVHKKHVRLIADLPMDTVNRIKRWLRVHTCRLTTAK